jgi:xanthine dehydrogenase accessory factor
MASAAARLLFLCGFPVAILERETPLAVRRKVSFAEAVFSGEALVEGIGGRRVALAELREALRRVDAIPVVIDPEATSLASLGASVLVDGRMAKTNLGTHLDQAALVIGLGPGLVAGRDVSAVVETQRGPELGHVIWKGAAKENSAHPSPVLGYSDERVLKAPCSGRFRGHAAIGDRVTEGSIVGDVDGAPVRTEIDGLLRGLLGDGVSITQGTKVGDVDPRGNAIDPARISDKARAVAAGTLEAVLLGLRNLPS